jgi:hypothetical protein
LFEKHHLYLRLQMNLLFLLILKIQKNLKYLMFEKHLKYLLLHLNLQYHLILKILSYH